jgi:hypothetical protein
VEKDDENYDFSRKTLSVMVTCKSIDHQDEVFAKLKADGYECRMLGRGRGKRQN